MARSKRIRMIAKGVCLLLLAINTAAYADPVDISPVPLFLGSNPPGNLTLVPSVETPTVVSVANLGPYDENRRYTGYFDADKCYKYSYSVDEAERHFYPVSTTANRRCTGADEWSGNFLAWAATQTIDPFRLVLAGGYRAKDTPTETWLEKARNYIDEDPNDDTVGQPWADSYFPDRRLPATGTDATRVQGATPFNEDSLHMRVSNQGNEMIFRKDQAVHDDFSAEIIPYPGTGAIASTNTYAVTIRVKVCDPSVGVESFCRQYDQGWKPEGLIQQYAEDVRFSTFGYINDADKERDGGVLRAAKKYVGPRRKTDTGWEDNPNKEWDPVTGVLVQNPDNITTSMGVTIDNSGVINYLTKFGQLNDNYFKEFDPVSELYYAAYRYLSGMENVSSYTDYGTADAPTRRKWADDFPVIESWEDPIQYSCQANVILGIGDVYTHADKNLPGSTYTTDEPATPAEVAADDSVDVVTETNRVGNLEGLGDIGSTGNFSGRNNSAFMAGLAYRARTRDIRTDMEGIQTIATHWVDVLEDQKLEPPGSNQYYLAAKYGGFEVPEGFDPENPDASLIEQSHWHTNGDSVTALDTNTYYRPDNYYVAGEAGKMVESLSNAFAAITDSMKGSSSSVAANSTRLDTDTLIFQARFDSADWSGELIAYDVEADGSLGAVEWRASQMLDNMQLADRNVFAWNDNTQAGVPFDYTQLSGDQQNLLDGGDGLGADRVAYLKGDRTSELSNGGQFRDRASRLGDIINSNPVFVHKERYRYGSPEGYSAFQAGKSSRVPALYVGGNDGMLHAFNANTGEELFAYMPGEAVDKARQLTNPGYEHDYFVDGTPTVGDAYIDGAWRTILIGTMGAGGRTVFALDISDPSNFDENDVLWEFSHDELGEAVEQTALVRMEFQSGNTVEHKWAVIFGNGYNTTSNTAQLFVLDAETGALMGNAPLDTEIGDADNPNGMAPPIVIDSSGDNNADTVYAGDLHGNMWKFDLASQGDWQFASMGQGGNVTDGLLFTAERNSVVQPITAKPQVGRSEDGDLMVYFGTGKYLEAVDADGSNNDVQSFYGLIDQGEEGGMIASRDDLLGQEITVQTTVGDFDVRVTSDNEMDGEQGWYLDLLPPDTTEADAPGEKVVTQALLRGGVVTFATVIPSLSPCDFGGDSWVMSLDAMDGSRLPRSVFDVNDDGKIDEDDFVNDGTVDLPASGRRSTVGVISRPTVISAGTKALIYTSGSTGDVEVMDSVGDSSKGRQSWRQIR